jgi:phage terminase large subunit-like protein
VDTTDTLSRAIELRRRGLQYRETHKREFAPDWYPWQREFHAATARANQTMLLASNRSGKTLTGSYATACDVTGRYPPGWQGAVIDYPVNAWALGVDGKQTRDVMQKELLGIKGLDGIWRGGWIHNDEILDTENSNLPGAIDRAVIRHSSGGESILTFRSYTQSSTGQATLPMAGQSVDVLQVDEQPPDQIVGQLLTRTMTGRRGMGGLVRFTLTPELGMTEMLDKFMNHTAAHRVLVGPVAWSECPHLSPEIQKELLDSYPAHERDMRSKGIPMFGTGKIFTFDEELCQMQPVDLMLYPWWKCLRSIDIGIDHPTAIAWLAYDPESDVTHVVRTHRASDTLAAVHASIANSMWRHAPMVVPKDIDNREPGSGKQVSEYYREAGVNPIIPFQNPDGSNFVEPGIFAMQEAFATGRLKVWRGQASHFLEEARSYHRDERGKIVKLRDDAISAVRYGFQMVKTCGVSASVRKTGVPQGGLYPNLHINSGDRKSPNGAQRWPPQYPNYRR